jgi:multiple sugar transport system permease protein
MSTNTSDPETTVAKPRLQSELAVAAIDYAAAAPSAQVVTVRRPPRRARGGRLLRHVALLLVCGLAILPFLWMLSTSLKSGDEISQPPHWIPHAVQWQNYLDLFRDERARFLLWTRNSLLVSALVVLGTTSSSALVAYGFARLRFFGRGALFAVMIATMMIPFPVTMVSLFALFRWLGDHTGTPWIGTFKPLWVPAWFGSAFSIFLLRQFFLTIPMELSEAAKIDGCSEFGIFWRIILPLSKPALAVVALFAFLAAWNDFLGPLVYLQRPEQFTLALGLQNYQSKAGGTSWHLLMAASTLVVLPALLLFILAQRTFIEGIATTGSKG